MSSNSRKLDEPNLKLRWAWLAYTLNIIYNNFVNAQPSTGWAKTELLRLHLITRMGVVEDVVGLIRRSKQ
ncbi:hypothetical protein Hanom_Chr15g01352811 [Helianthus anomalus]